MNDKTIELIDFITLLNADGEISKKEKTAILAKAKSLEIGPEEAEVIIDQFTTNPESVMTIFQKHRDFKKSGAPIENTANGSVPKPDFINKVAPIAKNKQPNTYK